MRLRNARLRTKVTALLVSLTALWAFTAWVTVGDGLNMLGVATLDSGVADPSEKLIVELQAERRLTAIALGTPGTERRNREALSAQRERTDRAGARFREITGGNGVTFFGSETLERRIGEVRRLLDGLPAVRKAVDEGRTGRTEAIGAFTGVVDSIFRAYDALATLDDQELAKDTRTLIAMNRARDMLAQGDSLVIGALTAGRLTEDERVRFTQIVGTRRFLLAQVADELPAADQDAYRRMAAGEHFTRLRAMEDLLIENPSAVPAGLIDARRWSADAQPAESKLAEAVLTAGNGVVERAARWPPGSSSGSCSPAAWASSRSSPRSCCPSPPPVPWSSSWRSCAAPPGSWPTRGCRAWWSASAAARTWTSPPRRRPWSSATTRSARSARRSTSSSRPRSGSPPSRPSSAGTSPTSCATSPAVPRDWSTAS
nr:hypothetical protein GCM10020093_002980 [Planobispora longispora]